MGATQEHIAAWVKKNLVSTDKSVLEKACKTYIEKTRESHNSSLGYVFDSHDGLIIVWYKDASVSMSTVLHEINHVVDRLFSASLITTEEMEFRAYFFDYVYRMILKELRVKG